MSDLVILQRVLFTITVANTKLEIIFLKQGVLDVLVMYLPVFEASTVPLKGWR